ncbi:MAG: T9SS type A sorting domain-containing protein, partial [Bacteroidia bacterium]|nr:T9SS type A sorting domain-containing protein [Bacteroidia bacterium]
FQYSPPCDLAEPLSTWYGYPEVGYPAPVKFADSLYFDTENKMVGEASVKFVTSRGWFVALNYRPYGDSLSVWSISEEDTLRFWVKTKKFIPYGFQYFQIRIGDRKGNYFYYTASPNLLNAAHDVWKKYKFPLSGDATFQRGTAGQMSWDQSNYVEFWADTWDYGFTLWLDGVQFQDCDPVTAIPLANQPSAKLLQNYPNPFTGYTTITYTLAHPDHVRLAVTDLYGNLVETLVGQSMEPGEYKVHFPSTDLPAGVYLYHLQTSKQVLTKKLVILH